MFNGESTIWESNMDGKLQGKLKFIVGAVMVIAGWFLLAEMLI